MKKCIIIFTVIIAVNLSAQIPEEYCSLSFEQIYQESLTRPVLSGPVLILETDNFVIHYTLSGSDATNINYVQVISEAAEHSWDIQINQLGWREPPNDDNRGGNNKYDIYIRNIVGAVCSSEVPTDWNYEWAPSYIEITNGYNNDMNKLRSVIAHEFNHASQIAYTYRDGLDFGHWFYENTSVWMEYIVYPEFKHYLIWLTAGPNPITLPHRRINSLESGYRYGGFLWPLFLSEWTQDSDVLRSIWERMGNTTGNQTFEDINHILVNYHNTNIEEAFSNYAVWRWFTGTRADEYNYFSISEDIEIQAEPTTLPVNLENNGACSYHLATASTDLINIYFTGEAPPLSFSANVVRDLRPVLSEIHNIPLTNNSGNLEVQLSETNGVVFIPVRTDRGGYLSSYDYSITPINNKRVVRFENRFGDSNLGGHLLLNNSYPAIPSGNTKILLIGNSHTVKTMNERFSSPFVKHNTWYGQHSLYFLSTNFLVTSTGDVNQYAQFQEMKPATIRNVIDGVSFNDGLPIRFNDPWYVKDANDNQSGMGDFIAFPSPFSPTGKYNQSSGGIFLDQSGPPLWNPPYYSIKAENQYVSYLNHTGKTHRFYFNGWSGTNYQMQQVGSNPEGFDQKAVLFTNTNAVVNANYKGTQLSDNATTYNNGGQRKFVRLKNGNLFNLYKSMDNIWLEESSDNGQTWRFISGSATPFISGTEYFTPSMDAIPWDGANSYAAIVYGEDDYYLKLAIANTGQAGIVYSENININDLLVHNPVVATTSNRILIVSNGGYDADTNKEGLMYFYGEISLNSSTVNLSWIEGETTRKTICGSNEHSKNVTVVADKNAGNIFHIAWEENNEIKYCIATGTANGITFSDVITASYPSGYTVHHSPVITELYQNSFYVPKLVWIGERMVYSDNEKEIQKIGEGEGGVLERKVLFRDYYDESWSPLFTFGNNVVSASINKKSTDGYVIAWSQETTNSYLNKYIRNTSFSAIYDYSTFGRDIQLSNGSDYSNMFVMSFSQSQIPYNFTLSNPSNGVPLKDNSFMVYSSGREGIISKDEGQFYFGIADIKKDGNPVEFIDMPDSARINSLSDVNTYLVSEPFTIDNGSTVFYSVQYGINDSASVVNSLSENDEITFKLELVNAQTGSVIGTFDEVIFNANNLYQYNNIAYQLQTDGISNTEVFLRLNVETNIDNGEYLVAGKYADDDVILKTNYRNILLSDITGIKDYALIQNYPNPFNPTTKITYQLPYDGFVTLRVYDILGKEVNTLVNELKSAGRYEAIFNAGDLASGVYIYKVDIKGVDGTIFSDIKKMMLLK